MRVILRDAGTQKYYCGAGEWTIHQTEAKDLKATARAVELASLVGGDKLEIVLAFEDPAYDVTIPVSKLLDGSTNPPEPSA